MIVVTVIWPLLLSLLVTQADAGTAPFPVRIEGNLVLPDTVYANILQFPEGARPDLVTAGQLAAQVHAFLLSSGYELAEVSATVDPDGLTLHIDEGQLERVIFRGRFTVRMLRFRLALNLPREVFNRPHLEREVAERSAALGIEPPVWELVETTPPPHESAQLDATPSLLIAGRALVRPGRRYELRITFGPPAWNTGVGLSVRTSYLNGLELGVNTQGASGALHDDRWRVALSGGLALRNDIPRNHVYVFPSRVAAEALWYAPPLDASDTRPFVLLSSELLIRQRRDFGLESYLSVRTEVSGNVQLHPHRLMTLQVGGGLQHFWVGEYHLGEGRLEAGIPLDDEARLRAYADARLELTFFDGAGRWDRRHALAVRGRLSANLGRFDLPLFGEARLDYQLVVPFGWHDLWFRGRATWMGGDVLFPFEEAMGQHLPAVFGDVWLRSAAGVRIEYRHSLLRDVIKAGVFTKGLVWGDEQRDTGLAIPRAGVGAGPSVHLLLFGFFQLDLFVDFAVLSNGRFGVGLQVWLNKVF
ncbi:MAG: hypothetical protein Q8K32_02680 [Archangium sp.]|nr:hypothetical protein [Archangium sp.]